MKAIFLSIAVLVMATVLGVIRAQDESHIVRLATTTSTDNSGLLDYLLPQFEDATGYTVRVLSVGTGKALQLGKNGDVDVLLVHAPHSERHFIEHGYGVHHHNVMANEFVLVGEKSDPAKLQHATSAIDAFIRLKKNKSTFISRGDNSGTHKKENDLWKSAGIDDWGNWRLQVGQGMGKSLQIADELQAYTLIDIGTWLAFRHTTSLKLLYRGDYAMHNPYSIMAVNPKLHRINYNGALALIDWLTSPNGQTAIGEYKIHGMQLFMPANF